MRHVMPTAEVYHLWANEAQDHARNSNRSASFNYAVAYSYNTPIARIVTRADGAKCILVTRRSYSITTTSKHMPALRRAIPSWRTVFHVEEVGRGGMNYGDGWEPENAAREVLRYAERIAEMDAKQKRARANGQWWEQRADELRREAASYCEWFGIAAEFSPAVIERITREQEHARALRIEQERQREARARAEQEASYAEAAPLWRNRAPSLSYVSAALRHGPTMLRMSSDGVEVETSLGARVHAYDARVLYLALALGYDVKGRRIGPYIVHDVTPEEVVIGCHHIPRAEVERIASEQGWSQIDAEQSAVV